MFTGPAPTEVLEAGHLYSYAANGTHQPSGGLLLRRDIHRLFDNGRLAVDPKTLRIDVDPGIAAFPEYGQLQNRPLRLNPDGGQRDWLALHWTEHRPAKPEG